MKALTVFYSRTGTTKKAGEAVAKAIKSDIDEIIDLTNRAGAAGWLMAGRDATLGKLTKIKTAKDPGKYDLVIIGTPVWSFNTTPAARAYITENKKKLKKVAFFCTMDSSGDKRAFKEMENVCGKKPESVLTLTTKEVRKGDFEEKVKKFAKELKKQ